MQPSLPTRILLIDDHPLFNDGIKNLLDSQYNLRVCGQIFNASEALSAIKHTNPNLILLDANLQGVNGIDLGRQVLYSFPSVKILILTMYNQLKLVEDVRRAGLHGYLLKDATTVEMLRGIYAVLAGESYFDPRLIEQKQPNDNTFDDEFAHRLNLTFREIEIIQLIRDGLSTGDIADRLFISPDTVKTHRKNIYFKLHINKVTELIQFATRNGF